MYFALGLLLACSLCLTAQEQKTTEEQAPVSAAGDPQAEQAQEKPPSTLKDVKKCSEADVECIGNRKLGGMDWYSIESEIRMGKQYSVQIEASVKIVTDPVINEYVNRVGQNIVRNSDCKIPFTIKVIDSDVINAFAIPGGFFYVNSGLILAADEEAELAGVMAHEIAHVCARHATRQMTKGQLANYLTLPVIFIGGPAGIAARQALGIALPMTFLKFTRGYEAQADYLGIQYMYKAGYDPNSFVTFFEKIQAQEKKKPGTMAKIFSDHPPTPDRIEKSQTEIATILPPRDQYIETTSEFNDMKARLAMLQSKHKPEDNNPNKPTLRRSSQGDKDNPDDKDKNGEDRPKLKRRDQ